MRSRVPAVIAWFLVVLFLFVGVSAQTTTFTYQGSMKSAGIAATGSFDFEFALFDALAGGSQVGSTITALAVPVTSGTFSVPLNFGSQYPGADRYLEIRVRTAGGGAFTTLAPRQQVSSSPYSVKSVSADTAVNATQFGGLAPTDFLRNSTTPQAANLNISGNGTIGGDLTVAGSLSLNIVNAQTQYNLGGNRLISTPATDNLFVGIGAGTANTTSFFNSFFGKNAGAANTTGGYNSFFGSSSGLVNSTGGDNSFFGTSSGHSNTTGNQNSFFGSQAGFSNTTGGNSFFGAYSGYSTTTGDSNSFFGAQTGQVNSTGFSNTFVGAYSGSFNTTGNTNSFFGRDAGFTNSTGSLNSFFGRSSGYQNTTGGNNSFFGVNAGQSNIAGNLNSFFGVGAGFANTESGNSFFGYEAGKSNTTGTGNSFFGLSTGLDQTTGGGNSYFGSIAGLHSTTGEYNSFFGASAGQNNAGGSRNTYVGVSTGVNSTGNDNTFMGMFAGYTNTTGSNNTFIGKSADASVSGLTNATAVGSGAVVGASNSLVLGNNANVGIGVSAPPSKLTVAGIVETTTGGVKFPDGTIQTSAALGSGSQILNQTIQQAGANFNIDGTGTAAIFDVSTQYNFNGQRFISLIQEETSLLVGVRAGENSTSSHNSFFGYRSGGLTTAGGENTFAGYLSGLGNTSGNQNTYLGAYTGNSFTSGDGNTFIGTGAGGVSGNDNTALGRNAGLSNPSLNFATAIGAGAQVGTSNTIVIGRATDTVNIPGTLTKASGSFRIDHPLDPTNKYLFHSFVESPDMMNIYNGNITTDENGDATVELPGYFEALNRDFRYQLTVIGTFAQAIIAEEISGNRFKIKTDKPNVKVSWQVTGVRKDAFAEQNRIKVEVEKPVGEKGKLQNPEAFPGKP